MDPPANSATAAVSTTISATFDQAVTAATPDTFVVHGSLSQGTLGGATVTTAGPTATHQPATDFQPGELVRATITSGVTTTGGAATPRVWQFYTASPAGSGEFADSGQVLTSGHGNRSDLGDVDGDGDVDVLGDNILLNDGTGVFSDSGQALGSGEFVDVDGDGDLDVVRDNVFLNDGNGIFTATGQSLGGGNQGFGDLDGDGDIDVIKGVAYGAKRVWLNNGSGTFADTGQALGTVTSLGIEVGDLDGDGDLDFYSGNFGGPNRVWLNDGSANFTDTGQALGGFSATRRAIIGDIDNDGDLDAISADDYGTGGPVIWLNDGDAMFTSTGSFDAGTAARSVTVGDLDADGDLDAVVGSLDGARIWENDGAGNFSGGTFLTWPDFKRSRDVDLGDVDGDGDLDLFVANYTAAGARLFINQNLEPSVSLSVDNATVPEAAGVSTVTASLSAVHTSAVTIDLGVSGDATATDDYIISGTQIVIPAGATSGSVTVTAVQDAVDEPDETVVIDITGTTNGQEAGTQQVTINILDDDEPIPVPEVTLAVDNGTIAEDGGVATFTANLSVVTTVPVTIDFLLSGTADASDYTASATQIVVAPGSNSGSIAVTATQDAIDEPDESIIVDIASVTGGSEVGTQQQTATITDDDDPPVPNVTLGVDTDSIAEATGVATFTLTLSQPTTVPVTIDLATSGTASGGDYTISGTQIVVAAGSTSGVVTVTAAQDEVDEPDETIIIDIAGIAGGIEVGEQQETVTILDDDTPPSFVVTSLEARDSGFLIRFNNSIDGSDVNLYDTQNAGLGAADVVVSGAVSGNVAGSLIVSESSVEFVKSGEPMVADTYTVTLRSAADGFEDTGGMLLDGNADGTGGDDYVNSWTIDEAPAGARAVGIPDFVRGPGQDVNLPADGTTGIPISISDGTNVRAADIRISYDPALLTITGATAPAGGTVVVNTATPGLAILVYFATTALPAGPSDFIQLQATVPTEDASNNYRRQQVVDLHDVVIGDGNDNEFPVVVDDALHFATYFADVSGNGRINASDAAQVARYAALIDSGFAASLNTDPVLVGDISGNGRINAADASRVAQFAALITVPEIPPVPGGIAITGRVPGGLVEDDSAPASTSAQTPRLETLDAVFQVVERFVSTERTDDDWADPGRSKSDRTGDNVSAVLDDAIAELSAADGLL